MSKALLPQAFWFRLAASAPFVEAMPRPGGQGPLLDLPAACTLPDLGALEGRSSWASVRVAWNQHGLGVAVLAEGRSKQPDRPEGFADIHLWVDTRDTRNVSRATRFCHRFSARLVLRPDRKTLDVDIGQRAIARALADAPICDPSDLSNRATVAKGGWGFEVFLPAKVLHGFDPENNSRLGFAYQVSDHEREDQFLGVGRDFPLGENPGLWATLELKP
ncbi:hypothetical protein OJF2_28710 [Aquisphaera giovannonii]|uniref:Carbohydrate-binding domain-containing protein n=1 Tax=Aquisphaera giovannonii TaxID=406548 RepID=A0A5B9W2R0_9BACT|nr:hypothetical protein [Aquisphaera giovannonii]QEH34335.1 hypothetical protein OJF2_28710 [Aquisphaera giovannonii]